VLAQFGRTLQTARQNYREFVAAGFTQGRRPDLVGGGLRRSAGAWHLLQPLKRGRERWAFDQRILGSSDFVTQVLTETPLRATALPSCSDPDITLHKLISGVAKRLALTTAEICANSHRPAAVNARALVCYAALRHYGLSPTTIAKRLGVSRQSVARAFERAQRLTTDIDNVVGDLVG
jgi:chromosomal replication initiation ATPase DnaA